MQVIRFFAKLQTIGGNFKMASLLILAASTILLIIVRHFIRNTRNATQSINIKSNSTAGTSICLTPKEFTEKYKSQQGQVKGGTLCFWGHWFGRPFDNFHQISSVDFDTKTNILIIRFAEQGALSVTNPVDIKEYKNRIEITKADKVHWQWYYYGKTQEPENLFYYVIERNECTIKGMTNANWYRVDWSDLTITKPAVLLT